MFVFKLVVSVLFPLQLAEDVEKIDHNINLSNKTRNIIRVLFVGIKGVVLEQVKMSAQRARITSRQKST